MDKPYKVTKPSGDYHLFMASPGERFACALCPGYVEEGEVFFKLDHKGRLRFMHFGCATNALHKVLEVRDERLPPR